MLPLHCYIYSLHRCHHLAPHNNKWLMVKPEPIMFLPITLSRISHYSNFIPMLSPIILYYSSNLIVSLVKLHMAAVKYNVL